MRRSESFDGGYRESACPIGASCSTFVGRRNNRWHFIRDIHARYHFERTVERAIAIVSEAVKSLPGELLAPFPDIEWQRIISIGNHLRHEYHHISPQTMFDIATVHLPALKPVVEQMLRDISR